MNYCMKCGTRLPEDEKARFCPNCGAPLSQQMFYGEGTVSRRHHYAKETISLKARLIALLIALAVCFSVTSAGTFANVSSSEAQEIMQNLKQMQEMLEIAGVQMIYGNNLMYCLMMFIPVLGPFYGSFVLYSTGRILAVMSTEIGADPFSLFVALFLYPHSWLEYVSYSLAISESFWLLYSARYGVKGFRNELSNAAKAIAICAVLLLLGALAEIYLISSSPPQVRFISSMIHLA